MPQPVVFPVGGKQEFVVLPFLHVECKQIILDFKKMQVRDGANIAGHVGAGAERQQCGGSPWALHGLLLLGSWVVYIKGRLF